MKEITEKKRQKISPIKLKHTYIVEHVYSRINLSVYVDTRRVTREIESRT